MKIIEGILKINSKKTSNSFFKMYQRPKKKKAL